MGIGTRVYTAQYSDANRRFAKSDDQSRFPATDKNLSMAAFTGTSMMSDHDIMDDYSIQPNIFHSYSSLVNDKKIQASLRKKNPPRWLKKLRFIMVDFRTTNADIYHGSYENVVLLVAGNYLLSLFPKSFNLRPSMSLRYCIICRRTRTPKSIGLYCVSNPAINFISGLRTPVPLHGKESNKKRFKKKT